MEWFIFALLAPIMWALNNVIDKVILTKYIKSPISYQILVLLFDLLVVISLPIFIKISFPYPWNIISILMGVATSFIFILYNKAIMIGETSKIVPLMYLTPMFVLPLAFIFLREILVLQKYLGIFLLVASAMLISYEDIKTKSKTFYTALILVLIFDLAQAGSGVAMKYLLKFIDYWSFLYWFFVGGFLSVFIFLAVPHWRKNFIKDMKLPRIKTGLILKFIGLVIFFVGMASYLKALTIQNVSLVSAVPSTQPLFVLIYATVLSVFMPKILKEKISKKIISLKLIAIVLIIIGTWLVVK